MRGIRLRLLLFSVIVSVPGGPGDLRGGTGVCIAEIAAAGDAALPGAPDTATDWIEILNGGEVPVDLGGWALSDDPAELRKWVFPARVVAPGERLVVAADDGGGWPDDGSGVLHAGFRLDKEGEPLLLSAPDGTIVDDLGGGGFPAQRAGFTYGRMDGIDSGFRFFAVPSPGAPNPTGEAMVGFVGDTRFSVRRGYFDEPFLLEIATDTPGARIRYTTDGSWPTDGHGFEYDGPIEVARTCVVKAAAFLDGWVPTDVDSHTYVCVDDIVRQTRASVIAEHGLPDRWGRFIPANYGMDGNPAVDPVADAAVREGLKAVPVLSIAMDAGDLFGPEGIYANAAQRGSEWERRTSLELIDPAGAEPGFQQDAALRIQGGIFRSFGLSMKKSFRVLFKKSWGADGQPTGGGGALRYPLFGPTGAREFECLTLRMESNDGWQWADAGEQPLYARDEFARRSQLDLGWPAARGRHFHLLINGVYWGVYNAVERPDAGFAAGWLGADPDRWEGQNAGGAVNTDDDGDDPMASDAVTTAWTALLDAAAAVSAAGDEAGRTAAYLDLLGCGPDGARNPGAPVWLNVDNFIDYLLVNWYVGSTDWPHKNFYNGRDASDAGTGFHFFAWDSEWSMLLRAPLDVDKSGDHRGTAAPHGALLASREYRVRFGDRAHRAFFGEGALTPAAGAARLGRITRDHPLILAAEAARWGNQHGGAHGVDAWTRESERILGEWMPRRSDIVLAQLRAAGLYPALDAPEITDAPAPGPGSAPESPPDWVSVRISVFPPGATHVGFVVAPESGGGPTGRDATGRSPVDPRSIGGAVDPAALLVDLRTLAGPVEIPIPLAAATTVGARFLDIGTGEWSALAVRRIVPGADPAASGNLVVSEFCYHPREPDAGEAGSSSNRDDFEFLELTNAGARPVDLSGCRFVEGIRCVVPPATILAPGQRVLLARDPSAFEARYGAPSSALPLIRYDGRLDNAGERILLVDPHGHTIRDFSYDDRLPWPESADGGGASLVLLWQPGDPVPDHGDPASWVPSNRLDGAPGADKLTGFPPDGSEDVDGDGLPALLEFALGTDDLQADSGREAFDVACEPAPSGAEGPADDVMTVTVRRSLLAARRVDVFVEHSDDLVAWRAGDSGFTLAESIVHGDGTLTETWRLPLATGGWRRAFVRLRAVERDD